MRFFRLFSSFNPKKTSDSASTTSKVLFTAKINQGDPRYRSLRSGIFDFNNAPVFSSFLAIIIVLNLGFLLLSIMASRFSNPELASRLVNDKNFYPLYFTANNRYLIYCKYQFWRLFSFAFTEDSAGFTALFSAFFVFLTFYRIGYKVEICLGSLKTFILLLGGILLMGLLQFSLSRFAGLYFYGTEYLTFLCLGGIFFFWTMKISNNDQTNTELRNIFIQVFLLACVQAVFRYVKITQYIQSQPIEKLTLASDWAFFAPAITFAIGYFLTAALLNNLFESKLLLITSFLFLAALVIVIIGMISYVLTNEVILYPNFGFGKNIDVVYG